MKKIISSTLAVVLLFTFIFANISNTNNYQLKASAVSINLATSATASTTCESGSGTVISSINDGNDTSAWSSSTTVVLPKYVTLDFGTSQAIVESITIVTHYATEQGITLFDIEYYDGAKWKTHMSNVSITWTTTGWTYENQSVTLSSPIQTSAVRLNVKAANRLWGNFCIDEVKLMGSMITKVIPTENTTSIVKNPAMGWVIYFDQAGSNPFPTNPAAWWANIDSNIADASIIYIRVPWSQLEPTEGNYAWINDQNYKDFIQMAQNRGLKLAFSVMVDSKDMDKQATPDFVRLAGCTGYTINPGDGSDNTFWTPYVTNSVFQTKFANFISAFATEYDDPDVVDYIDCSGLGWWGEMHHLEYLASTERTTVFNWLTNLFKTNFHNVLLGELYGPNSFSYTLHDQAMNDGFAIRRCSFGSPYYLPQWDKDLINQNWIKTPVFAESCYQLNWTSSWQWEFSTVRQVAQRTLDDAKECHANTLDLRNPADINIWVNQLSDLTQDFALNGGYRIVPTALNFPAVIKQNGVYKIETSWKNTGVGKIPNNNPWWNYKYKASVALLDQATGQPVLQKQVAEPSSWVKNSVYSYETALGITDVPVGTYDVAVAIVDGTKNNIPGINLAIDNTKTSTGWYKLGTISVEAGVKPAPQYSNTAPLAWASSSYTYAKGYAAEALNNGNTVDSWSSAVGVGFPGYITLDYGTKYVSIDRIDVVAHYGQGQGITNVDIQYYNGSTWVNATTNSLLSWYSNTDTEETNTINFTEVYTNKIRLKINNANTTWGNIGVNEIKVWGLAASATGVSLNNSTATIGKQSTIQLVATVNPSNAENKTVVWSSSDSAVATVSAIGLVTGVSLGTATITATTVNGGFTATCAVTVKRYDPNKYYKITYDSNSVLAMDTSTTGLNGVVKNVTYTGANSQQWQIVETTDASTFKIVNRATGYALKVNSTTNSTNKQIIQTTYASANNMNFTISESAGYVQIVSKLGSSTYIKCTGASGGTMVTATTAITTRWDITLLP